MRESGMSAADWQVIEYVLCEGTPNTIRLAVTARQDQVGPGWDRIVSAFLPHDPSDGGGG